MSDLHDHIKLMNLLKTSLEINPTISIRILNSFIFKLKEYKLFSYANEFSGIRLLVVTGKLQKAIATLSEALRIMKS